MTESDDDRLLRLEREIFNAVLDKGFLVHYVPADAASLIHQNRPYAYTVGRTLVERSEFLVTGLSPEEAKAMLTALVRWDDQRVADAPIAAGGLAGLFVNLPLDPPAPATRVKLILADPAPLMTALVAFGLNKVSAVQALWPRAGGYPGENDRWAGQPIHPYGKTPLIRRDPYRED